MGEDERWPGESRRGFRVLLGGVAKSRVFDRIMPADFARVGVDRGNAEADLRPGPWRMGCLGMALSLLLRPVKKSPYLFKPLSQQSGHSPIQTGFALGET
jgi:hypothetical protein